MANKHATLKALFTDTADAIREKSGDSATIVADTFPDAIRAIPAGGGVPYGEWTKSGLNDAITCLAYGNGIWLAGSYGRNSGIWISNDGLSWRKSGKQTGFISTIVYGGGIFVAGSRNDGVWWSENGQDWAHGSFKSGEVSVLFYADGTWLASNQSFSGTIGVLLSKDGKTWEQSDIDTAGGYVLGKLKNVYIAGDYSGYGFYWSTSGKNWNAASGAGDGYASNIASGAGIAIYGDANSGLFRTANGKTWASVSPSILATKTAYGEGVWVAAVSDGLVYSLDGESWNPAPGPKRVEWLTKYNGGWLAGAGDGVWVSSDGKSWSKSDLPNARVVAVAAGSGDVVVAANGAVWRSSLEP